MTSRERNYKRVDDDGAHPADMPQLQHVEEDSLASGDPAHSFSGSFLQTLPDLVTPLKGHSIFISAQLSNDAVSPPKGVGINKTVEATSVMK